MGFITPCEVDAHKYDQRLVVINRNDVETYEIISDKDNHHIYFNLKENLSGFAIENLVNASHIDINLQREDFGKLTYYNASVSFFLEGAEEYVKNIIKQLDSSNYFIVAKFGNTIEVIGFETAFDNSGGYNASGSLQTLNTKLSDSMPPLVYKSLLNSEIDDFNNNFEGLPVVTIGDYNEDYNEDYFK